MSTSRIIVSSVLAVFLPILASAQWAVIPLHPAGATNSWASCVNAGSQVGFAMVNGVQRASLWTGAASSWVDLHPIGAQSSQLSGTEGGQQVGYVTFPGGQSRASLWAGSASSWLDLSPSGATVSGANGVSSGQQVGYAVVDGRWRASLWSGSAASWVDLSPIGTTETSIALAVSGGQQVGNAFVAGIGQASLWTGNAASWVSLHPAGSTESRAYGVDGIQQVGVAVVGGTEHASLWSGTAGSWIDLHPVGATWSYAYGVSGGIQAGEARFSGKRHAGLWNGTASSWEDLHLYLPGHLESFASSIARDLLGTYVVGVASKPTNPNGEAVMWVRPAPGNFMLILNKSSVAGQNSVLGTILMGDAKATDTVLSTYDNSSLVTTPPTVTVLANQFSRNFQIRVTAITGTVLTTIYAKLGGIVRSQSLTLTPLIPTAVVCTPNPVTGGQPTSCRVVINGVAGPGGRLIATFDNSIYATTPSTVTVPAGATDVTFPITTLPVTSIKTVTVTARVSAGEKTGTFRINP